MSKTIGNRQKPGWQRVRKAEADHQKRLLKKFQDQKKNSLATTKKKLENQPGTVSSRWLKLIGGQILLPGFN
ncbi:MAG: hypothetical protein WC524_07280 [Candidatus Aminicenantales bacterium]|nr:hypothetical protein [Acidobacteriota bacterium]